jgi:hypothetical protein
MTALRTTRPDTDRRPARPRGRWVVCALAAVSCAALAGCGSGEAGAASGEGGHARPVEQLAAGPRLPAPDPDRIAYDASTGTITFYELPDSGRWMVQRPGDPHPVPTGPELRLPPGTDPWHVHISYVRPGGQQSRTIPLRKIQERRTEYTSFKP